MPTTVRTEVHAAQNGTHSQTAAANATPPQPARNLVPAALSSQPLSTERHGAAGASSGPSSPPPTAFATMMAASRNAGVGSPNPKSPTR